VQLSVQRTHGVMLEPEVRIIGEPATAGEPAAVGEPTEPGAAPVAAANGGKL
jgi:hypothetical protein